MKFIVYYKDHTRKVKANPTVHSVTECIYNELEKELKRPVKLLYYDDDGRDFIDLVNDSDLGVGASVAAGAASSSCTRIRVVDVTSKFCH